VVLHHQRHDWLMSNGEVDLAEYSNREDKREAIRESTTA
jgi:hypothetical protein